MNKLIGVMLALVLAAAAHAGPSYTNTTFGYRLAVPDGWQTNADNSAAAVMLGLAEGPMKAKLTAAEKPSAVTPEISDRLRARDEAALTQRAAQWKRIPCSGATPGSRWACAYRTAAGAAQINVTSLFSYPRGDKHVWIRLSLVAPLTSAKEAGRQMRALVAGFAADVGAPVAAAPSTTVVGKSGPADAIVLDDTGSLSRVTFEAAPLEVELAKYQQEVFQPVVGMEARLAKLFDDVQVRADRNELTPTGKIAMFREVVSRYKAMLEPLEASVPSQAELAQAHTGVVGFYRERAGIYERIVENTAKADAAGVAKAAQELAQHDFQNTQAFQQLSGMAQRGQPATLAAGDGAVPGGVAGAVAQGSTDGLPPLPAGQN